MRKRPKRIYREADKNRKSEVKRQNMCVKEREKM